MSVTYPSQKIFGFIENNDLPQVRQMITEDPGVVFVQRLDYKSRKGCSPLQAAAHIGSLGIVKHLIQKGAIVYDANIYDKSPPVIHAYEQGHIALVDFFLKEIPQKAAGTRGLGVDICWAAAKGWTDIVKKHLDKDPYCKFSRLFGGGTPLHWASLFGHLETMEALISAHSDLEVQSMGTPLHWAAAFGPEAVKLLIQSGANVNARLQSDKKRSQFTPLMVCASQARDPHESVSLLLNASAHPFLKDKLDKTALDYAKESGAHKIIEILSAL